MSMFSEISRTVLHSPIRSATLSKFKHDLIICLTAVSLSSLEYLYFVFVCFTSIFRLLCQYFNTTHVFYTEDTYCLKVNVT